MVEFHYLSHTMLIHIVRKKQKFKIPKVEKYIISPVWCFSFDPGFVQGNQCNKVFGCLEEERFERCTCYRDCGYDGELVCGSDGHLYQNQCQMEVFACRNGTRIEQVLMSQCPQSKTSLPGMGSIPFEIKLMS